MVDRRRDVLRFKVELVGVQPPVWREILVPAHYSFWDLHVAIQDAMGWLDYHLHEFRFGAPSREDGIVIGIPTEEDFEDTPEVLPGWDIPALTYFARPGDRADYVYDFGDDWCHEVILLAIETRQRGTRYPLCAAGERACPPEDCGGIHGYALLLDTLFDPTDPEHESTGRWIPENWGPEQFIAGKVRFDNPGKRWERTFLYED